MELLNNLAPVEWILIGIIATCVFVIGYTLISSSDGSDSFLDK